MDNGSVWVAIVAIIAMVIVVFVAESYVTGSNGVTGNVVVNQCCIYADGRGYFTEGSCGHQSRPGPCSDIETLIISDSQ